MTGMRDGWEIVYRRDLASGWVQVKLRNRALRPRRYWLTFRGETFSRDDRTRFLLANYPEIVAWVMFREG